MNTKKNSNLKTGEESLIATANTAHHIPNSDTESHPIAGARSQNVESIEDIEEDKSLEDNKNQLKKQTN